MPLAAQHNFDFDPLDVTKTWPEDRFPLQPVGRLVLNRNVDNFFAENEMLAFCPSMVVPGVAYSDDKLLQTRIFSYADTQRHRLGPNYLMLPANAPRNQHHNNHHDGFMNFMHRTVNVALLLGKFYEFFCTHHHLGTLCVSSFWRVCHMLVICFPLRWLLRDCWVATWAGTLAVALSTGWFGPGKPVWRLECGPRSRV